MDRWRNRVAVVTGASAGIGAAICIELAKYGMKVVGCARGVEKIQALAEKDQNIFAYKCDMRNDSEVLKMFDWIESNPQLGRVDVCIPNAGLSKGKSLMESTVEDWRNMTDVNIISLNLCTQLAIKSMRKHDINDGQVIFLNSLSGHRLTPGPSVRFYASTKFAVKTLCEGWRQEVREFGPECRIRIAQISPGVVETEFAPRMYADDPDPNRGYNTYRSMECLQADDMALLARQILEAPPHVNINDVLVRPTQQKM